MARPDLRLVAKPKGGGPQVEVAACWKNEYNGFNLKFVEEASEGKLPLADVLNGEYWLNLYPITDKKQASSDDDF